MRAVLLASVVVGLVVSSPGRAATCHDLHKEVIVQYSHHIQLSEILGDILIANYHTLRKTLDTLGWGIVTKKIYSELLEGQRDHNEIVKKRYRALVKSLKVCPVEIPDLPSLKYLREGMKGAGS